MRRRPDHLLRNLFITSLIIIAAMHPDAANHLAQLGTGLLLAIAQGAADAAAANPGAAALVAGATYIAHQIRTHRPAPARTTAART
ncbi:hypothetical protein [Streptomyces sp. NPDC053367]|uniref:hypothetical protein n=1 Tax=Streptomyces sp. NPDC053367 TaxID=3365700 RepID=UPI0037D93197